MYIILLLVACADDNLLEKREATCSEGSYTEAYEADVGSLDDVLTRIADTPLTLTTDWADFNYIGAEADEMVASPIAYTDDYPTICEYDGVWNESYAMATFDVVSAAWLPSGEVEALITLRGGEAADTRIQLSTTFDLPEDYRVAAHAYIEGSIGAEVDLDLVPSMASFSMHYVSFPGYESTGVGVYYERDQVSSFIPEDDPTFGPYEVSLARVEVVE